MSTHQQHPASDPKAMARRLRQTLADRGVEVSHSEALELVAQQYGARDWNTLAAEASPSPTAATDSSAFGPVIPVLRIFDVAKAREFYGEFLGFAIDWEHTFDDHSPVYLQASREGALLHLSEHHGDATPGATVRILVARRDASAPGAARPRLPPTPGPAWRPSPGGWRCRCSTRSPTGWSSTNWSGEEPTEGGGTAAGPIEHEYTVACTPRARVRRRSPVRSTQWWHPAYAPPGLTDVTIEPRRRRRVHDAGRRRVGVPAGGP